MFGSQARTFAILQAQAAIAQRPVYLDTETTGLDEADEIVEICIVDDRGAVLVDSLVKPRGRIPADVVRIHGITNEMVRHAPAWPELWPAVEQALAGRPVAIYNADFDLRMMRQSHRKHRMEWTGRGVSGLCVMRLYADFHGEWDGRHRGYRWQTLEDAGCQCGIALPNAHRARADALLARAVLHYVAGAGP